jgi:hypothetical protein
VKKTRMGTRDPARCVASRSSASSQPVALPKVDCIGGPVELRREARMEQLRLQFVGT